LDAGQFVPAAGQGCLAVQIRDADEAAAGAIAALPDVRGEPTGTTEICFTEERSVVHRLGATCNTPIGVHASGSEEDGITVTAFVGMPDGSRWIRDRLEMPLPRASGSIGGRVAERLQAAGADELLAEAERLVAAG
jgi:hydroxymethylbilane synthase